ncbi:glycerophosphodiester phosphodiesterase family protein [Micromonospora sp. NPDC047670]|uniref:glycerophosphodiester phosphodiesterase family protein n=1 Tax=Micromonospora sp. NPDC047670 TaxID=3364252 RepID=UPI00371DECFE
MSPFDPIHRRPVSRRRRVLRGLLVGVLVLTTFCYVNNTNLWAGADGARPALLAHRGLAQTFGFEGMTNDTCTAQRIHAPEHPYLENTITSMRAAFDEGADIVEFDVQLTKDDRLVVFHDHTLECRTNGTGKVRDHTLAELRRLDIGYNYTSDGGATYPFRGKGVGLMPTIDEVTAAFPERELLIDVKSSDAVEGERLADHLATLPAERLKTLTVYGGDEPIAALASRLPQVRVLSMATLKDCLYRYIAVGWTGHVPAACENRQLHIPETYAPWLWGWPHKFVERMAEHHSRVVIVAGDGGFSEGFDSADDWARLPDGYTGVVWTNRVDRAAALRDGS